MRKKLLALSKRVLSVLLLCAASCGARQEPIAHQTTEAITESTTVAKLEPLIDLAKYDRSKVGDYSEEKNTFSKKNAQNVEVVFVYPQLIEMHDKTKQQEVNKFLYETILINNHLNEQKSLDMIDFFEMNYRLTLSTPEIVSIAFGGVIAGAGGANSGFAYGLTIDLNTMQMLELSDFVAVDENLVNNLLASEQVFNFPNSENVPDWDETVRGVFRANWTAEDISPRFEYSRDFYVTPTTICVMFPI